MATNLRLRADAESALRAESERSGRTQQEIIREALDRYLGLERNVPPAADLAALVSSGAVRPPRTPYARPRRRLSLPAGTTTAQLLDRTDRV